MPNLLEYKVIRDIYYIYWNRSPGKISVGKLSDIKRLLVIRTRSKSRDRQALLDILTIFERENMARLFYEISPKKIDEEIKRIELHIFNELKVLVRTGQ